nr:hypothetical protein SPCC63.09 - fission yeast (Schizosaccharomyces pombe) [Schizosaccharomyces pombe]
MYNLYHCTSFMPYRNNIKKKSKLDLKDKKKRKEGAYSTPDSHVVSNHSTNEALRRLTAVIGRELVFSPRYGRRHLLC